MHLQMATMGYAEYRSAVESARGGEGGTSNGLEVVLLENLDEIRRWLLVDHAVPPERVPGFRHIAIEQARVLREDDPELAALVDRACRLGLPLFEGQAPDLDAMVRDLLPAPVSRRLGVLPVAAYGPLLGVLMSDPETTGTIEFMVSRRVVPILAAASSRAAWLSPSIGFSVCASHSAT